MKKSGKVKKSKTFKIIIFSIVGITALYTLLPDYLQKGMIYLTPDIDDYKIFDNREVETGTPRSWPLTFDYNQYTITPESVRDSMKTLQTTGFLIIKNDSLLFEQYSEGHNSTTISNSFSMAKSIVSLLIGCAIEDGHIGSLDDKVKKYLPWLKGPHSDQLTIRHLLTMSSASDWDEHYSSPFSITTRAYYGRDLPGTMKQVKIVNHPGIMFNYRSGDTQFLERILSATTGMPLADYASKKLWEPLGAEVPALWSLDRREGTEKAYCCFSSTPRDFARIGSLVLNGGLFHGKRLISDQYIKMMTTPAKYLTNEEAQMVEYYGLHWWVMNYGGEQIPYARGILGQYIFVIPSHNAVIVRLGHQRSNEYRNHHPKDAYTWIRTGLNILEQRQ
ncbi:serine hydrolase domain-containing protein [Marinilabilia salmonicolor]|uniref:serine hydrolase domain-containing protein n=1 Tax=Marinilabilia salmonicolor TaxID=989 RepID=UPI00029AEE5F|nr:serine hydrolase [Marinilabilia salmonicolor]